MGRPAKHDLYFDRSCLSRGRFVEIRAESLHHHESIGANLMFGRAMNMVLCLAAVVIGTATSAAAPPTVQNPTQKPSTSKAAPGRPDWKQINTAIRAHFATDPN